MYFLNVSTFSKIFPAIHVQESRGKCRYYYIPKKGRLACTPVA